MKKHDVEQAGRLIVRETELKKLWERANSLCGIRGDVHFQGHSGVNLTHFLACVDLTEEELITAVKKLVCQKIDESLKTIDQQLRQLGVTY